MVLSPPGTFEVGRLRYFHLVTLQLPGSVQCVSFHTRDLPRLQQIPRAQLIDSPPACYPETRAWAQAGYLQRPSAQAISYGSRRNDAGRCLMLFEQRMPDPPFQVLKVESLAVEPRRREVLALVRSLKRFCRNKPTRDNLEMTKTPDRQTMIDELRRVIKRLHCKRPANPP